jgi:hypothetical protein
MSKNDTSVLIKGDYKIVANDDRLVRSSDSQLGRSLSSTDINMKWRSVSSEVKIYDSRRIRMERLNRLLKSK